MTAQHGGLTKERWAEFDLVRRILMIGNELHRASKWRDPGHGERRANALERTLALLDLTVAIESSPALLRELLRLRDCVAASYIGHPDAPSDRELLRVLLRLHPGSATQVPHVAA